MRPGVVEGGVTGSTPGKVDSSWRQKRSSTNHVKLVTLVPIGYYVSNVYTQEFSLNPGSASSWLGDLGTLALDFPYL